MKTPIEQLIEKFEEIQKKHCKTLTERIFFDGVLSITETFLIIEKDFYQSTKSKTYKRLEDLKTGDFVECVYVHGSARNNMTKGKEYEVVRANDYGFTIVTDSGKKREYGSSNNNFKAVNNG